MKRNIYISNLDSPLSYHISQYFREDHLEVEPNLRIVGSSSKSHKLSWIHATINFEQHPQLACRTALDCDVIILDLRYHSHEAETLIRFLKQTQLKSKKKIKVIGISSLLTWEGVRCYQLQSDKETMMSKVLDESQWRSLEFKDKYYELRIPGVFAIKCYELENLLLSLNQTKNVTASVLATGVIYGKENQWLQNDILRCFQKKDLTVWGQGNNLVPLVHIQTVLESLKVLFEKDDPKYTIAMDLKSFTQASIKEMLIKALESQSTIQKKEVLYTTEQECIWSLQPKFACSSIFNSFAETRNFQNYCSNHLMEDLCEYTQWSPVQCVLFLENFETELLEDIRTELIHKIEMINEDQIEKINTELMLKNISDPESDPQKAKLLKKMTKEQIIQQQLESQQPQYEQTFNKLLLPRKYKSFIVICSSKLKQFLVSKYFFNGLCEIVKKKDSDHNQIEYNSKDWFNLIGFEKNQSIQGDSQLNIEEQAETNADHFKEKSIKRDDKMIVTTQYLLDNVLGAISEAKFNMKSQGKSSLRSLIDELKNIYSKSDFKPCLKDQKIDKTAHNKGK